MGLGEYRKKRSFGKTKEPKGTPKASSKEPIFVIQKHYARTTHFDLRLEIGGVLKSWAVPKGPPKRIGEKHLAVHTEDHPMEYASFEGEIPKGEYGAGKVVIWDKGAYENVKTASMRTCYKEGKIEFRPHGSRLKGTYALIRFKGKNWLLIKVRTKR